MSSFLSRELVFLILQFLGEENFKGTAHSLEQESRLFFNMRYFTQMVTNGEWDEVEKYISAYTKVDDNQFSRSIFFEIKKQQYLEALDRKDGPKALEILVKDLKRFSAYNQDLYKELTLLLTSDNFRFNSPYGDTNSARRAMMAEVKKLIKGNPVFHNKLTFPRFNSTRLQTLVNQSLRWQQRSCNHPPVPQEANTLLEDHSCSRPNPNSADASSSAISPLLGAVPRPAGVPYMSAFLPFPPAPALRLPNLPGWMANPAAAHASASAGPLVPYISTRSRTPANIPPVHYQTAGSQRVPKRARASGPSGKVNPTPVNLSPVGYSGQSSYSSEDLPKAVVMTLYQGSTVKSMDFHPKRHMLLLVGTNAGDFTLWDLGIQEKVAQQNFTVWDLDACSMPLQTTLNNDYTASVNRVTWTPDGTMFGVAYSKNIVQIYSYHGGGDIRNHLEIEAHSGSVNDLAFSFPNKTLSIVTCGDDMLIKVWNVASGDKENQCEGHEAPVYSVCPHFRENIQFIFSSATDGNTRAWQYNNRGSVLSFAAPGQSPSTMAYSDDGIRLFSCGTNKEGQSFIVEWNEREGNIKRAYNGLGKRANRPVQFDTTKNRYIVAGDEWLVKYWNMDNADRLLVIDAEGGLPASPCVRFNKEGMLLAVSTNYNEIKILANSDGVRVLKSVEKRSFDASRVASSSAVKTSASTTSGTTTPPITMTNSENQILVERPRTGDEATDKSRMWKVTEISEPSHCRCLRLPDDTSSATRVARLVYTNSGLAVLALAANAVHKLWKWQKTDENSTGKATASGAPQLWQPTSGILMTNDISDANTRDSIACFAVSKHDSYVASASGGKISLFNLKTFKTMTTCMPPPPAATFLVLHPQDNNVIAIGMDDSSIHVYNIQSDELKMKLKGHDKKVTGLAFSNVFNVLVSSGADSRLCVWSTDGWEKQKNIQLRTPGGWVAAPFADTHVQFHQDQTHLLVVHETHIAIFQAPKFECLKQWDRREATGAITHAAYSCDSRTIYVTFKDGSIEILTASTLRLRCRISSTSYLPSNPNSRVYPLVVAAHPSEPNQFALGLTDGGVCVIEPLESEGEWGSSLGVDDGVGSSTSIVDAAAANATDQAQR